MDKFADKDTSYKEKVAYAKEASKTVTTIYDGQTVGLQNFVVDSIRFLNNINSLDDFINNPKILENTNLSDLYVYLKREGYHLIPLVMEILQVKNIFKVEDIELIGVEIG